MAYLEDAHEISYDPKIIFVPHNGRFYATAYTSSPRMMNFCAVERDITGTPHKNPSQHK